MTRSGTILLIDDDESDVFAMKRALKKAGVTHPLHVLTDGLQAVEYFSYFDALSDQESAPPLLLVLLDLKLPYYDGFQVLEAIRKQSQLADLPVVMLTGSDETRDQQKAFALGARAFLSKPASVEDITRLLDSLQSSDSPSTNWNDTA